MLKQVFVTQTRDASPPPSLICDPLLRDTLARLVDCDPVSFQRVLQYIQTFVEVVHFEGYSQEMIICEIFLGFPHRFTDMFLQSQGSNLLM